MTAFAPLNRSIHAVVRWFFRHLYTDFAWAYDVVASLVSLGRWNRWVTCIVPDINHSPILEIGHGPGHLQLALRQAGYEVTGLDSSQQMGSLAYSRLRYNLYYPLLVNGYAQFIPFAKDFFQAAVSTFPAEYIFEPATISEIWRVLRPGGVWIWLPTAWLTGRDLISRLFAGVFVLTQQAPEEIDTFPEDFFSPITDIGFRIAQELRKIDNSVVLVIKAYKPMK